MQTLPAPKLPPAIDLDTVLAQTDSAFCHLTFNAEMIDLSYPGGHVYVHRGALESLLYIVNTPRFTPRDIPGGLSEEARVALANKLVSIGYLAPTGALQA
jgi:hypothetical protein